MAAIPTSRPPMTDNPAPGGRATDGSAMTRVDPSVTGWVGWAVFGGVTMIVLGAMNAIYGLVALLNDDWAVWTNRGVVFLDITQWGWVHLIVGGIVAIAGVGVLTGNGVARLVGAVVVALAMLVSFVALPVYPLWSLVVLTLEALVLYALLAHGGELRHASRM